MTRYADTRLDLLSASQRKRVSITRELLTGPSLMVLDEPTLGLDPALDRQVMTMLRQLADAGRVVLLATNTLVYLNFCDQVLLLTPGGKTAFYGPPHEIGPAMGTTNWADIFSTVANDPAMAHARYLVQRGPPPPPEPPEEPTDLGDPLLSSPFRQFCTVAQRQLRLIVSDRGYFTFLALLPFIIGALSLMVPGTSGFGRPDPAGNALSEPSQILALLNTGAVIMGTALTVRDLFGERPIFLIEQAVGLSTSAYLLAKIAVFSVLAVAASAIMTMIVIFCKGGPTQGAVWRLDANVELVLAVAATCVASTLLGLLLSALARSDMHLLLLVGVGVVAQILLSGGLIAVTGRVLLDQLSWLMPARWGFAATASVVALNDVVGPPISPDDALWEHSSGNVVVRHGHARRLIGGLCRTRIVADPAQTSLTDATIKVNNRCDGSS